MIRRPASGHDSEPDPPDMRACARRPPKCRHHARSADIFACSDVRRHRSTRKPGRDLGDPGCRDQSVKAWSGPTKKPDRPDPAKGDRRPGRSAKLLAPGYRHVGPPAAARARGRPVPVRGWPPRATESRTARAIGRKALSRNVLLAMASSRRDSCHAGLSPAERGLFEVAADRRLRSDENMLGILASAYRSAGSGVGWTGN